MPTNSSWEERRITRGMKPYSDNFDRLITNPLIDLVDVAGDKKFTPERLRFFKDGSRRFLQYGTDSTFTETDQGHELAPGSDQTLTLRTAEKAAYQVGYDLWPTQSYVVIDGPPEPGDVIGGGYGVIDLANFDPGAVSYTGSTADGYFWYHTNDTGLDAALLAMVQNGTVLDSRTVDLETSADKYTILEQQLNWYAVGPSRFKQISTDIANHPDDPQVNKVIGAVANDDGAGPSSGNQRQTLSIYQASGNSGLKAELGSVALRAPGPAEPQFKAKRHDQEFTTTNDTAGTWQVVGAIKHADGRKDSKLRLTDLAIIETPGSSVEDTRALIMSVHPDNTDADSKSFSTPLEQSQTNSIVRVVADNSIVGPIEDDAGTDVTGAATANTMTNPGGYQIGKSTVRSEGTGSKTSISEAEGVGNRELYPSDIGLILADTDTTGTVRISMLTEQNS